MLPRIGPVSIRMVSILLCELRQSAAAKRRGRACWRGAFVPADRQNRYVRHIGAADVFRERSVGDRLQDPGRRPDIHSSSQTGADEVAVDQQRTRPQAA